MAVLSHQLGCFCFRHNQFAGLGSKQAEKGEGRTGGGLSLDDRQGFQSFSGVAKSLVVEPIEIRPGEIVLSVGERLEFFEHHVKDVEPV